MQGDLVKALRIVAERKGWDPTRIEGKEIEVGLTIRKPDGRGDMSLSPFPGAGGGPDPDQATYDNPARNDSPDWNHPTDTSNANRRGGGADPFPGMPGAQ